MRIYGIETKGMIISLNDFQLLLSLNKKTIDNNLFEDIDNLDFSEIVDFAYMINNCSFIGEFDGYLRSDINDDAIYYNNEDVILLELQKNTLYDKYNNKEEIIKELKDDLKQVGIIVDDDFINKHFGYINGSFYS